MPGPHGMSRLQRLQVIRVPRRRMPVKHIHAGLSGRSGLLRLASLGARVDFKARTIDRGSGITKLSAGNAHVLALKSDGTVLAWGLNSEGQLGDGSTASHIGPVQVTGLGGASQVSAGWNYSLAVYLPPHYR
jgi:alpha-tubulin suppressor-like RCC1 family protein